MSILGFIFGAAVLSATGSAASVLETHVYRTEARGGKLLIRCFGFAVIIR